MYFTMEVDWTVGDFLLGGFLLTFFGYLYQVLLNISENVPQKIIGSVVILLMFFSVWINLI